jgi:hypothetical protein
MAYVMDNSRDILDDLVYEGIYRDNGIVVFKGLKTTGKIANWLRVFQERVNNLAGFEFLEFTAEIWGTIKMMVGSTIQSTQQRKTTFCFLTMEMYWSPEGNLQFRVHLKENQVLKYLNRGSTHTEACFAAVPTGVMKRPASLITRTDKLESMRMDKMYPMHAEALQTANLVPNIFPTLGKILDNQQMDPTINDKEVEEGQPRHKNCMTLLRNE